jgi:hypothetical protein
MARLPLTSWDPADVKAHLAYYEALNKELEESGELVGGEALGWPEQAKTVWSDGTAAPVVTDGPYAEAKEVLATGWTRCGPTCSTCSATPRPRPPTTRRPPAAR